MEHPRALAEGGGTYRWHAGAPDDEASRGCPRRAARPAQERGGARRRCRTSRSRHRSLGPVGLVQARAGERGRGRARRAAGGAEYVAEAYGEALEELAKTNARLVVLDADLASDCRVRGFEQAYPERFLEVGIAEQDMVSVAGGLARHGLAPVVNSFASFLASRANEQIYNNASEGSKVVYGMHYAGLIPAGPGMSHQSLRDVSLLAALPEHDDRAAVRTPRRRRRS